MSIRWRQGYVTGTNPRLNVMLVRSTWNRNDARRFGHHPCKHNGVYRGAFLGCEPCKKGHIIEFRMALPAPQWTPGKKQDLFPITIFEDTIEFGSSAPQVVLILNRYYFRYVLGSFDLV